MFCKNCGAQIPEGSAFCGECGQRMTEEPQTQETANTPPQQPAYTPPRQPAYAPPQQPAYAPAYGAGAIAAPKNTMMIVLVCVLSVLAAAALVFMGLKLFSTPGRQFKRVRERL